MKRTADPVRSSLVTALEGISCASNLRDADEAICRFFESALPHYLRRYAYLLIDYRDLEAAVKTRLAAALCLRLHHELSTDAVESLYPSHVRQYLVRACRLLEHRLDPSRAIIQRELLPPEPDPDSEIPVPCHEAEVRLVLWLEDTIRVFAAGVLIGGPPPARTTKAQRARARRRRLEEYLRVCALQNRKANFTTVCTLADVERKGTGSGAMWLNGSLADSAKTSKAIELVLNFQTW